MINNNFENFSNVNERDSFGVGVVVESVWFNNIEQRQDSISPTPLLEG